ncbi:MAG: hypothetical protein ACRDMZ_09355, partial [Solirubrobacteraceae bacterium]
MEPQRAQARGVTGALDSAAQRRRVESSAEAVDYELTSLVHGPRRDAARSLLLEHVRGAKPKTLLEHRYLLVEPRTPHRRGRGEHRGLIMDALGDRPAEEITTREINAMLTEQAASDVA